MFIDIVVTAEKKPDLGSRLIMWWTKSKFSHCLIRYDHPWGKTMIFQATSEGVNVVEAEEFFKTHIAVDNILDIKLNCTPEEFVGYVEGSCGKDYSESQYLGFLFNWKWLRDWFADGDKELVCSELVASVIQRWTHIRFDKQLDYLTPAEVLETVRKGL